MNVIREIMYWIFLSAIILSLFWQLFIALSTDHLLTPRQTVLTYWKPWTLLGGSYLGLLLLQILKKKQQSYGSSN